jgi:hypothetical protein
MIDGLRYNQNYAIQDEIKSSLVVFFFQRLSMLDFQREMQERKRRNTMKVQDEKTTTLDKVEPGSVRQRLCIGGTGRVIDQYRYLTGEYYPRWTASGISRRTTLSLSDKE